MSRSKKVPKSSKDEKNNRAEAESQRITVTLGASSYEKIVKIAQEQNISISEAVRRSIRRDLFVQGLVKEKEGKLLIEFPDGKEAYIFFDE